MLPLTADKVRNVAAHMKHAGYRAWNNYAGRAKEEHVASGHAWSLLLETCFRKAARRSVLRGIGPSNQAVSLDLTLVHALDLDELLATPAMPIGGA